MRLDSLAARARSGLRTAAVDKVRLLASHAAPYRPMRGGPSRLNTEYRTGYWDYLAGVPELPRFSVVAGYCLRYQGEGRILEIGCGEGLLPQRLGLGGYTDYVGVDISSTVIERANERALPNAKFLVGDARSFEPGRRFDLVLFHEVLEYMEDPAAVVRRYEDVLEPGGHLLVSQFKSPDNARTRKIWKRLHARYPVRARAVVSTVPRLSWTVEVLGPLGVPHPPP